MSDRQPRDDRTPIEEVLERINAQPIPEADDLAQMSMFEIERQLAELGVDSNAELRELLDQVESPPVRPLANLSARDVEQLSTTQVERQLEAEGVDVRAWLSRAEMLIRNARLRAPMDEPRASTARAPSRGLRGEAHRPGLPRSRRWQRRRVPQALAASIVMVAIAGVTLSMLDEPEFDVGAPMLALEGPPLSPASREPAAVQEELFKREGTRLVRVPEEPQEKQAEKQSAFTRDLHSVGQPPAKRHRDALHDEPAVVAMADPPPASRMIPPKAPTSPPASTAIASANAIAQHKAKTEAMAKSLAGEIALRTPVGPQESPEAQRSAPSRRRDPVAQMRSEARPGAPMPRAAAALRKEKKTVETVASADAARQQRFNAGTANEADEAATTVHVLRAGRTLAMSLAGLSLREADRKALLRVFFDVDVSAGANLRLSMHNQMVQTADLQLPQGRSIAAVRDSQGELVLKR